MIKSTVILLERKIESKCMQKGMAKIGQLYSPTWKTKKERRYFSSENGKQSVQVDVQKEFRRDLIVQKTQVAFR